MELAKTRAIILYGSLSCSDTQACAYFQAFQDIIRRVPDLIKSPDFDKELAETRASILYSLHSRRSTATGVMHQAIKSYFAGANSPEQDRKYRIALFESWFASCSFWSHFSSWIWQSYFSNRCLLGPISVSMIASSQWLRHRRSSHPIRFLTFKFGSWVLLSKSVRFRRTSKNNLASNCLVYLEIPKTWRLKSSGQDCKIPIEFDRKRLAIVSFVLNGSFASVCWSHLRGLPTCWKHVSDRV